MKWSLPEHCSAGHRGDTVARPRKKARHQDHGLVRVSIAWNETDLRIAVKKTGAVWRPRHKLWEMSSLAARTLGIGHRAITS